MSISYFWLPLITPETKTFLNHGWNGAHHKYKTPLAFAIDRSFAGNMRRGIFCLLLIEFSSFSDTIIYRIYSSWKHLINMDVSPLSLLSFTKGNLLSSKTIPDMTPSPSTTNSAAAMAERRNHEMFAERHADRIFQVLMGKLFNSILSYSPQNAHEFYQMVTYLFLVVTMFCSMLLHLVG